MHQPAGLCLLLMIMTLIEADVIRFHEDLVQSDDLKDCKWTMPEKDFPFPPLLVTESADRIILPEGEERIFRFQHKKSFWAACPGDGNKFKFKTYEDRQNIKFYCHGKKLYIFNENLKEMTLLENEMDKFGCTKKVGNTFELTDTECGNVKQMDIEDGKIEKGVIHRIGFQIKNMFCPLITVCFVRDSAATLWSRHTIRGKNLKARKAYKRGDFVVVSKTDFFPYISMSRVYEQKVQSETFKSLKIDEIRNNFIDSHRTNLEKGHLSPVADFVSVAEMEATMYYTNSVPQWFAVNRGNWRVLEEEIQHIAGKKEAEVNIISGGYGIQTMRYSKKNIEIFLGPEKVPVPELLWKVVTVEKENKPTRAVVFVIINDPFRKEKPHYTQLVCQDICDDLDWINDSQRIKGFNKNLRREICYGYTYCCKVDDEKLRKKIPTIPDIGPVKLLKDFKDFD